MKRTIYNMDGISCAGCASKIETEILKIDNVKKVSVSAVSNKIIIESDIELDIFDKVVKIVNKFEPNTVVSKEKGKDDHSHEGHSHEHGHSHGDGKGSKRNLIITLVGVLILIAAVILERVTGINAPKPLYISLYLISYALVGAEIVYKAITGIFRGQLFDENFLMALATIGALALGEFAEAIFVMVFYRVGEYFQDLAVARSRKNVYEMMKNDVSIVHLKKDDTIVDLDPKDLQIGDLILVYPGEKLAIDGIISNGSSSLDMKSLTGESLPVDVNQGDKVFSGVINISGTLHVVVEKIASESTASKILEVIENSSMEKASTEKFITKFSKIYTPIVVVVAIVLAFLVPLIISLVNSSEYFPLMKEYVERALIFLVVSCPCALVLSVPLSYFAGIGKSAKSGILVKNSKSLEDVNHVNHLVFDKTGTVTKGEFVITNIVSNSSYSNEELLMYAAYAESQSTHPLAKTIIKAYGKEIMQSRLSETKEIAGNGITTKIDGKSFIIGNDKIMKSNSIKHTEANEIGSIIHIAENNKYIGYIILNDEVKPESKEVIANMLQNKINVTMLTGDQENIANKVASDLGIPNVYARCLPQDKVDILSKIKETDNVMFIGDGMNDAPVISSANVGVAMGKIGSDLAIDVADVVILNDNMDSINEIFSISKKTRRIVIQNIVLALGIKFIVLVLGAFGIAAMWMAIISDVGVSLLAVLNSMRILYGKNK